MPITRAARANRANRTLLLNKIKFAFGSVVSEFLFPICVQKILLFCVINSSRHRKCFVRGFIHSLFVSKARTRSYLARSGFDTNNSWIKPRTPHFLWRKLYIRNSSDVVLLQCGAISSAARQEINTDSDVVPESRANSILLLTPLGNAISPKHSNII